MKNKNRDVDIMQNVVQVHVYTHVAQNQHYNT